MSEKIICSISHVCKEFPDQGVYPFRLIRVGIMTRSFYPMQRDLRISMPCFIIPYAGTGMVLCAAYQQCRTLDFIGKILFHRFRQNTEAMPGNLRIALLISIVNEHHFPHQISAVIRNGNPVRTGFQKQFPRVVSIYRLHSFQKPQFRRRHIFSLQRRRVNGNKAFQLLRI